jgi:hypothetical protein
MDFYFVDERGNDSINFETLNSKNIIEKYKIASKYFQIGILKVNRENLSKFQEHLNTIRYFLNLTKEFEKIINSKKVFLKLWDIIENMNSEGCCKYFASHIEKEYYDGPYLYENAVHRFRIFNIYRNLSYAMKSFKTPNANKAQILIDRFSMASENEINAYKYLQNRLKKYYYEVEIAFIDSRCCDYLQLIDVIITVIDEKLLCSNSKFQCYNTEFITRSDFTTKKAAAPICPVAGAGPSAFDNRLFI